MSEPKTYSINFRLRRTTIEEAFVSIPLNDELFQSAPDENGYHHVDPEKAVKVAVELGRSAQTRWILEREPEIEPHPIQTAPTRLQ